jgi:hypothetical protein
VSTRTASYLAWSLYALCVALAVDSLILGLLNGRTLGEIFKAWSGPSIGALATLIVLVYSARLRDETDLEALNGELLAVVRETVQPARVSLWMRPETPSKRQQAD